MRAKAEEQPAAVPDHAGRWATRGMLGAAVTVALAAGVTTAHGLYEVAVAAQIPADIAWLYPVITDGLALVAYAATSGLAGAGRRYAWMVVVLAAGLSGVAQASYLAVGVAGAPPALRFGIGAWPAIAAAIVAHLLFLLGTRGDRPTPVQPERPMDTAVQPTGLNAVQPERPMDAVVQRTGLNTSPVQPARSMDAVVQPAGLDGAVEQPAVQVGRPVEQSPGLNGGGPARERAFEAAGAHALQRGGLPTVSELMALAEVSRGTAAAVLKELREARPSLHVVNASTTRTTL